MENFKKMQNLKVFDLFIWKTEKLINENEAILKKKNKNKQNKSAKNDQLIRICFVCLIGKNRICLENTLFSI